MPLTLEIVTPEAKVYSDTIDSVVIPTVDAEQPHYVGARARLRRLGIRTLLPAARALGARTKRRLPALGRRAGVGVPPTVVLPGMAAVDVFETEPILQGHPLLRLENAVCTPHIGYVEQDSYELYFSAAFENVLNFIHNTPTNLVNPEALKVMR